MRTLNPDTVLRVFRCDFRKIGAAERVVVVGEGDVAGLSVRIGGKKNASRRVGAPNRVEGRMMLSSLNAGTSRQDEHHDAYVIRHDEDMMKTYLKQFHPTDSILPVLLPIPRTNLHHHPGLVPV
jgi:hypothetical protein